MVSGTKCLATDLLGPGDLVLPWIISSSPESSRVACRAKRTPQTDSHATLSWYKGMGHQVKQFQ